MLRGVAIKNKFPISYQKGSTYYKLFKQYYKMFSFIGVLGTFVFFFSFLDFRRLLNFLISKNQKDRFGRTNSRKFFYECTSFGLEK